MNWEKHGKTLEIPHKIIFLPPKHWKNHGASKDVDRDHGKVGVLLLAARRVIA